MATGPQIIPDDVQFALSLMRLTVSCHLPPEETSERNEVNKFEQFVSVLAEK